MSTPRLGALAWCAEAQRTPQALIHAHSHNDYYRSRPLLDALDRGFASIEADVFLVDGQLLVGHYERELRPERSLQALYLEPLRQHVARNRGRVFAGDQRLTLLIDIKSDGPSTYQVLATLLAEYNDFVSGMEDGRWTPRVVDVVISGNRPIDAISADTGRRAAIDGRMADTAAEAPEHLVPLISENWGDHFSWRGVGTLPANERALLRRLVEQVHGQQRRLRFWGTADRPEMWGELLDAGVDVIGADNLRALESYLRNRHMRK